MNILEELWYGKIDPIQNEDYLTPEYRELEELFARNERNLLPTLNEQQKISLKNMKDQWEDMARLLECAAFSTGFRLAVKLMTASV